MIAVLPLGRPKPDEDADKAGKGRRRRSGGGLDRRADRRQPRGPRHGPADRRRLPAQLGGHGQRHGTPEPVPHARCGGRSARASSSSRPARCPRRSWSSIALVAVIVGLFIWPADFDLHAKGTLEPVDRKDVYAGAEGQIYRIRDGYRRQADRTWLLGQEGPALAETPQSHLERANGRHRGPSGHRTPTRQRHPPRIGHQRGNEARRSCAADGPVGRSGAEAEQPGGPGQDRQRSKVADLELHSPIDGQIVTWDVKNRLEGRPVQKGQALLRVADPEGEWELDLHMPEDHMGFIDRAKEEGRRSGTSNCRSPISWPRSRERRRRGRSKRSRTRPKSQEKDEGNVVVITGGHQQAGHRSGRPPRGRRRDRQGPLRPALAGLRLVPRFVCVHPGEGLFPASFEEN